MAVTAFRSKQINRIILTRPAVEAGEKLGFLPGDLQSKVDPYVPYTIAFYQKDNKKGSLCFIPAAFLKHIISGLVLIYLVPCQVLLQMIELQSLQ